ncbi:PEP-CTERM sorting domain-containing protein, partial [Mariniblastus sp.]|nr:PEP-CTERM sorting domain-containing protein [Mariniblastus sp.]
FNFQNQLLATDDSAVDVFATEFSINGMEVEFTDFDNPLLIEDRDLLLSGVYSDGSEFQYFVSSSPTIGNFLVSPEARFRLNLVSTAVPEPSAAFLLALGGMAMIGRRRKA